MFYNPRHALSQLVRPRTRRARAIVITAAAVAASAGGLAAAGTSGAATTGYSVGPQNISMGAQFAGLCLDDFKQNATAGAPVVIWTCSGSDPAQQWYMVNDGTIELGNTGKTLGVGSNGKVVLATSDEHWKPLGDWGVVNTDLSTAGSSTAGPSLMLLNDPGYATKSGTQLIAYPRTPGDPTANAQFNMPSTTYAQTSYTSRPDSGHSGFWSLDGATRFASVTALGNSNYEGSIADDYGTFLTVPGNTAPDGSNSIANVVKGSFNGTGGYTFTASGGTPSASNVQPTAFGGPSSAGDPKDGTSTSNWYQLFFPSSGMTFSGGLDGVSTDPMGWAWAYRACSGGSTNSWFDNAANNDGLGSADGNITGGC